MWRAWTRRSTRRSIPQRRSFNRKSSLCAPIRRRISSRCGRMRYLQMPQKVLGLHYRRFAMNHAALSARYAPLHPCPARSNGALARALQPRGRRSGDLDHRPDRAPAWSRKLGASAPAHEARAAQIPSASIDASFIGVVPGGSDRGMNHGYFDSGNCASLSLRRSPSAVVRDQGAVWRSIRKESPRSWAR
jgi:hypothetical protein